MPKALVWTISDWLLFPGPFLIGCLLDQFVFLLTWDVAEEKLDVEVDFIFINLHNSVILFMYTFCTRVLDI